MDPAKMMEQGRRYRKPLTDQEVAETVAGLAKSRDKAIAYWQGVAEQIEQLNAEVRARRAA